MLTSDSGFPFPTKPVSGELAVFVVHFMCIITDIHAAQLRPQVIALASISSLSFSPSQSLPLSSLKQSVVYAVLLGLAESPVVVFWTGRAGGYTVALHVRCVLPSSAPTCSAVLCWRPHLPVLCSHWGPHPFHYTAILLFILQD